MCGWLRALVVTLPCLTLREQPRWEASGYMATCGGGQTHSDAIRSLKACRQPPSEEGPFPGLHSDPLEPVQPVSKEEFSPAAGTYPPIPTSPPSPQSQSLLPRQPQPHSKADMPWLPALQEVPDSPSGTGTVPTAGADEHGMGCCPSSRGKNGEERTSAPFGAMMEMAGRSFGKARQEDAGLHQAPGSRMTFLSSIPSLAMS